MSSWILLYLTYFSPRQLFSYFHAQIILSLGSGSLFKLAPASFGCDSLELRHDKVHQATVSVLDLKLTIPPKGSDSFQWNDI